MHLLSLRGCMSTTLSKPVVDEGRRTGVASDSGDEWKGGGDRPPCFGIFLTGFLSQKRERRGGSDELLSLLLWDRSAHERRLLI